MKIILPALALLLFGYVSAPLPRPHALGYYTWNGTIWCTTRAACIHEIGHKLDDEAGWISGQSAFVAAVREYTQAQIDTPGQARELYADFYAFTDGDPARMPVMFRPFYDWHRSAELLKEYQRGR